MKLGALCLLENCFEHPMTYPNPIFSSSESVYICRSHLSVFFFFFFFQPSNITLKHIKSKWNFSLKSTRTHWVGVHWRFVEPFFGPSGYSGSFQPIGTFMGDFDFEIRQVLASAGQQFRLMLSLDWPVDRGWVHWYLCGVRVLVA
jgi:hypothetical protein